MCGVVGYVGHRRADVRLVVALERLENRGYDSTGICLHTPDGLKLVRAVGNLGNLKDRLRGRRRSATTGIGQLLAYAIARRRGLDVDQRRNLAKTVTVE